MTYATLANIFTTGMDHVTSLETERTVSPKTRSQAVIETLSRSFRWAGDRDSSPIRGSPHTRGKQNAQDDIASEEFVYNSHKISIVFDKACLATPREGWTKSLLEWYRAEDPEQISEHFVHTVFHLGRGAGKVKLHVESLATSNSKHGRSEKEDRENEIKWWHYPATWMVIAIANMATWRRFSNVLVCVSATSAFLASPNKLTNGIRNHAWMQGKARFIMDAAAVTEDISERFRIALNKELPALTFCAGVMLVHVAVYYALPSVSVISIMGVALTTATSLSMGHCLGADGISNPQQAQAEGTEKVVEK